jgi:integrase
MKPTTGFVLDQRRQKNDLTYPVKIRITFNRRSKLYKTNFSYSIDDFDEIMSEKPKRSFKSLRIELNQIENDASDVINKLPYFSFENFEKRFLKTNFDSANLFSYYDEKIDELLSLESIRSADIYKCAMSSIRQFHGKLKLSILEVTPEFLKKYELWMRKKGKSVTTTSIYLRSLRHIYNRSTEENFFEPKLYPFKKGKYSIPEPRNIKKALTLAELQRLYLYPAEEDSQEEFFRDIWFFSYLCNGINMKDICMLRHKDIQGSHIYFIREKTKNSSRNSKPIDVIIVDETRKIIDRWATRMRKPEDYVFPFLKDNLTPLQLIGRVKQATKMTNKYIKRVAKEVGIEKNITTYWARHSYATVLTKSNVGISFIKEALGHKTVQTTENYLGSFEDDAKNEVANKLLKF